MTANTYRKRLVTVCLAALLVVTTVIGATLAYLTKVTDSKANHMTFVNGGDPNSKLDAEIEEPEWNNNKDKALNMIPGSEVKKDPQVKNTSKLPADQKDKDIVSEWAAIKVTYEAIGSNNQAVPMTPTQIETLLKVMEIDYSTNASSWVRDSRFAANANDVVYYYNKEVKQNESTLPLFTTVKIKGVETDNDAINAIKAFAPNGINITVKGAVVQYKYVSFTDAQSVLYTEINK